MNDLETILEAATPGPWGNLGSLVIIGRVGEYDDDGSQAWGGFDLRKAPRGEDNARLIALAPDMAAELIAARAEIRDLKMRALADGGQLQMHMEDAQKLRSENAELRAAVEWQPIETAPKDGTEIDVSGGTYSYDAETYPTDQPFIGVGVCRWDRFRSGWRGEYGSEYDGVFWYKPTHWRHRPSPPQ